jgi:hypothetical protein
LLRYKGIKDLELALILLIKLRRRAVNEDKGEVAFAALVKFGYTSRRVKSIEISLLHLRGASCYFALVITQILEVLRSV